MSDLVNPRWMYLKAVLFVLIGGISASLILLETPTLRVGALLVICVWAFARAYYFAFYVIEKYIDPSFRFAGLVSALRFILRRQSHCPGGNLTTPKSVTRSAGSPSSSRPK